MPDTLYVQLSDGRQLAFCQWGPPDGRPVFYLHGSPGGRLLRHHRGEYERTGLRVITYDRPGYGRSTPLPGRGPRDAATDVAALADRLALASFGVLGVSGGGDYALAVGALLADRVTCLATIVAGAPLGGEGLDWAGGMTPSERADEEQFRARGRRGHLQRYEEIKQEVARGLPSWELDELDRELLVECFGDALASGPDGLVDDWMASILPWDIDLGTLAAPVRVLLARGDPLISQAHADWLLARLPDVAVIWVEGGHLDPRLREEEELLDWMAANI
jgi:pimeloyl-ACP methyl ester carboxylesterase